VAAAGLTVVSGMARGLDAVAHHAALDAGGGTIGILGNGLGIVYPAANRVLYDRVALSGCLLTEFPPGERPNAGSFPRRNRLISGLSRVTVVVEAGAGSGALITAECALAQGREVLAVPGPITSRVSVGTNHLIQSGAKPVLEPSDILEEYGLVAEAPQLALPADLSEGEKRLLDILTTHDQDIDILQGRYGAEMSEVAAVLTSLEIRGMVLQSPGKAFRRK
jgi:DNA processing protein